MIGLTIRDTYRVEELIGSGGMGVVYRARQISLDRDVAIKALLARHQFSDDLARRFFREARLLSQIHHPNIVSILDFGQLENGPLFMVMEFLDGMSVEEITPPKRGLSMRAAVAIMDEALAGVSAAHQHQMVHRDLKPSNIYLSRVSGGGYVVKILDFGIAKVCEEEDESEHKLTQTGQIMGTPGFISPEQLSGSHEADNRCDVYSLGAILYFLISGRSPYRARTTPLILNRQMTEPPDPIDFEALGKTEAAPLAQVILKAMAIDPGDRYGDVMEFSRALREASGVFAKAVEPEIAGELDDCFAQARARLKKKAAAAGALTPTPVTGTGSELVTIVATPSGRTPTPAPLPSRAMGGSPTGPLTPPTGSFGPVPPASAAPPAPTHSKLTVGLVSALVLMVLGFLATQFGFVGGLEARRDQATRVKMAGATDQGVTEKEILVGMTGPFSGPSRELGREMRVGLETGFASFNDLGGAHGRKVRLIALDDMMEPKNSVANVTKLLDEERVFAIVGSIGTAPNEACLPLMLERKRALFGPLTGADIFRKDPPDRYVFNYRASYVEESETIVSHMTEMRGIRAEEIAVFAQNDSFGDAGYRTLAKALRKRMVNPNDTVRVGYDRNTTHVEPAVEAVLAQRDRIKGIIIYATYGPTARFIAALRQDGFDPVFASVSFIGSTALAEEFREIGPQWGKGVIVTQVVPHYASSASVSLRYREDLKKYQPSETPSFGSLEGYLVARLLCQGIYRAGGAIDTERLVDALESIRGFDLGTGEPVEFGPTDHQASTRVWGSELTETGEFLPLDLN